MVQLSRRGAETLYNKVEKSPFIRCVKWSRYQGVELKHLAWVQLENFQKTEAGSITKPRHQLKRKFGRKQKRKKKQNCQKTDSVKKTEKVTSMI